MKKSVFLLPILLTLDILSKLWVVTSVPPMAFGSYPFGGIPVFSSGGITFSLNYIVNTGAAWGLFAGYPGVLFVLRLLIVLGISFFVPKRLPIWLVIAGALGNLNDYALYGHVIDFFHFTFWGYSFPIFNIADACITIGVLTLIFFPKKAKQPQPS